MPTPDDIGAGGSAIDAAVQTGQQLDPSRGGGGGNGVGDEETTAEGMPHKVLLGVGSALMNLIPGVMQQRRQESIRRAHQESLIQNHLLHSALEHPDLFDTPEVAKAAKAALGPEVGNAYMRIIGSIAKQHQSHQNAFAEALDKGDPVQMAKYAAAHHIDIPTSAMTAAVGFATRPQTEASIIEAKRPGLVQTRHETTRAQLEEELDPSVSAARAGAAGQREEAVQGVREPYTIGREGRADTRHGQRAQAAEDRAQRQQQAAEERAQRTELRKTLTKQEADGLRAYDKDGHPIGIAAGVTTKGQLRKIVAKGGKLEPAEPGMAGILHGILGSFGPPPKPPIIGQKPKTPATAEDYFAGVGEPAQ